MFESILEWVLIGLVLINLIALNTWHKVMHVKVQEIAAALNLLAVSYTHLTLPTILRV